MTYDTSNRRPKSAVFYLCFITLGVLLWRPGDLASQKQQVVWSGKEQPILEEIRKLRQLSSDYEHARSAQQLAVKIGDLPATENKVRLAFFLASRSTEGDFGHDTLQSVATTLAHALTEHP